MTELLSREEYAAIAATLDLPQRAFIDGGFRDACGGRTFASTNPATGELLAKVNAVQIAGVMIGFFGGGAGSLILAGHFG
ncbi:hypothetical protein AB3459_27075, partial [Pseudomonas aeruginosa]